ANYRPSYRAASSLDYRLRMSALTVACEVLYDYSSRLDGGQLLLATSPLAKPRRTAGLLRALMNIVRSRFHVPPAMLGRILAESDPVVTSSDDRLRFE